MVEATKVTPLNITKVWMVMSPNTIYLRMSTGSQLAKGNYTVEGKVNNIKSFGVVMSSSEFRSDFTIDYDPAQDQTITYAGLALSALLLAVSLLFKMRGGRYNILLFTQMAALSYYSRPTSSLGYYRVADSLEYSNMFFYNPLQLLQTNYSEVTEDRLARYGQAANPLFGAGGALLGLAGLILISLLICCIRNSVGKRMITQALAAALTPLMFFGATQLYSLQFNIQRLALIYIIGLVVAAVAIFLNLFLLFVSSQQEEPRASDTEESESAKNINKSNNSIEGSNKEASSALFCRAKAGAAEWRLDCLRRYIYIALYVGAIYLPAVLPYGLIATNAATALVVLLFFEWVELPLAIVDLIYACLLAFLGEGLLPIVLVACPGVLSALALLTILLTCCCPLLQ
jgi:hypothetical protein